MTCARCDRKLKAETSVYSPTLKVNYCFPTDWKRCDALYKKKAA